jgi:beta-lactam-binding protein with PASTA domain
MVNAFGYYASAKGMVLVPNLSELSSAAAISLLESSGLGYLIGSDVNTTNQALDNLVASQTPSSNTLVDYGSVVSFSLYNFVPVPPFFPSFPPYFPPTLPSPSLSLGSSGNAAGGQYFQVVFLTNYDGNNSYSPVWDSFESTYPEYIIEGFAGPASLTVTASRAGFTDSSSTINFTLG